MRTWVGILCVVGLVCGAGITGIGCGNVVGVPLKDAAQPLDTPISSGGTSGTGGVNGSGGLTGTGGTGPVGSGGVASGGSTLAGTGGGGGVALGGSLGTGGTVPTGGSSAVGGSGGLAGGVLLTATYDGQVHATWQNQTSQSIFLYGCGTVEWSRFEGADWVNHGGFIMCTWEGIAVEVAAGATYTETQGFAQAEAGRYRLSGRYGVGCTTGLGLSQAGCTAFFTATSNEFVIPATGGSGGSGAGGVMGSGGATSAGGAGGATSTCPMVPPCNWCGGTSIYDSSGCVIGWRCANGANPCTTSACSSSNPCPTGYTCGTDMLCWPAGTGGVGGGGGSTGTGGTAGGGGATGTSVNGSVLCGWGACSVGYACCVNESTGAQDCLPTSATCSGGFVVTCDGPEDCGAGQQCCMPSGAVSQTNCLGECLTGLAMCHRDSDCPQGQTCCPTISFGYSHSNCVLGTSCS